MVQWLNSSDVNFKQNFQVLLGAKREVSEDVDAIVRDIIEDVQKRGDDALIDLTRKFDRLDLLEKGVAVSRQEIQNALREADRQTVEALKLAAERIRSHHERQKPKDDIYQDALGVTLGTRWTALQSVGLYVPGGTASYPSSVLMNAIPAKVAGVERIVMVVPSPDGILNPLVLVAAELSGVDEIYRIGGAQAIAALAFGTKTIAPVNKIVGPGNAFVAAAKRRVFGTVGIDMIAGPSEVLIVADKDNNPDWIALDLLAQAEHDIAAQSLLITDDIDFGKAVEEAVEHQLKTLPRADIAQKCWQDYGAIIVVDNLQNTLPLINRIAPEHLELTFDGADDFAMKVHNAGAIFIGAYTPEAIGDYVGGSNHVLPTARSARFSSGLSILDFVKKTSLLKCGPDQLRAIGPAAMALAKSEGLDAHEKSVSIRLNI